MMSSVVRRSLPDDPRADTPPDDGDLFADWVRPHWSRMYALAIRMAGADAADDILQDALTSAWRHRRTFDSRRGSARTWLLTIVANRARRRGRERPMTDLYDAEAEESTQHQSEALDLARAMQRLSRRQRLAVTLHYYLGLSVADSAVVMRCSAGTVKSTLSDARTRLLNELGSDYR